jgi:ADP-ribose pyrophosphatase YjhB (NUDIX family)
MTAIRDTFCSYCGAVYPQPLVYPRACAVCKVQVWANPIPVSVVLVPVAKAGRTGIMVIRRGIQPGKGKLALVGGFVEEQETWAAGGAREVKEETGVSVDASSLTPMWFTSTAPRPNRVLLFSVAAALSADALGVFAGDDETLERGVVFGPDGLDEVFAFPLHAEAARRWFQQNNVKGAHDYATV